jgi:type I restriction enzyme M protein
MRKSLGDKRKEISEAQIAEITRLYAGFTEGERVKILPNEAFGYQRITIERPLRLRWEVTGDTPATLAESKQWGKLAPEEQRELTTRFEGLAGTVATERSEMATKLGAVPKAIEKKLWDVLAVKDPAAPIVTDRGGEPLPDPDLRDYENVPLPDPDLRDYENVPLPAVSVTWEPDPTERLASLEYGSSVEEYMATEVTPYVEDAWVDHEKTRIGYEIPLTRHFYKYVPPRPLAEIDAEIKALEGEIQGLLVEVTE